MQIALPTNCFCVGIDISKATYEATLLQLQTDRRAEVLASRQFPNTTTGHIELLRWMKGRVRAATVSGSGAQPDVHIGLEATGRYHEDLVYFLFDRGYGRLSVILPNKIKHFARSLNEYSKNDPLDARLIARYVAMHVPDAWQPLSPLMRQLRELSRERQAITRMSTQAKNRLKALSGSPKQVQPTVRKTIHRLRRQVKFFAHQIQQIEAEMDALRAGDVDLQRSHDLLVSVPYIGSLTAYTLLAETDGFVLFNSREQLLKYAGLDIVEKQSGSSVRGRTRISKRGNGALRSAPYPGLGTVGKGHNVFGQTYRSALARGLTKKQARTAVVRQVLRVAYGVHKSGQPYDEAIHRGRTQNRVGEHEGSPTVTDLMG